MTLQHKTFTIVIPFQRLEVSEKSLQESFQEAIETIDNQINDFLKSLHWSQSRDSFQNIEWTQYGFLVTRTLVYTEEQLATTPNRPPIGPMR